MLNDLLKDLFNLNCLWNGKIVHYLYGQSVAYGKLGADSILSHVSAIYFSSRNELVFRSVLHPLVLIHRADVGNVHELELKRDSYEILLSYVATFLTYSIRVFAIGQVDLNRLLNNELLSVEFTFMQKISLTDMSLYENLSDKKQCCC